MCVQFFTVLVHCPGLPCVGKKRQDTTVLPSVNNTESYGKGSSRTLAVQCCRTFHNGSPDAFPQICLDDPPPTEINERRSHHRMVTLQTVNMLLTFSPALLPCASVDGPSGPRRCTKFIQSKPAHEPIILAAPASHNDHVRSSTIPAPRTNVHAHLPHQPSIQILGQHRTHDTTHPTSSF